MLNAKAFAHAATVVIAVFYVACVALSLLAPDVLFGIGRSWMHSINLESVKAVNPPDLGSIFLGFITISGLTWITTFITIWLYNRWAK
ncbi:hypothetical protein HYW43_04140 [Candidatus Daviesbacteria bacterium]|nr:hypothetical protein [Candidatus Daviesbacteria bacterium]